MTSDTCAAGRADSQERCCTPGAACQCKVRAVVELTACPSLTHTQMHLGMLLSSCIGLLLPGARPGSSCAAEIREIKRKLAAASLCPRQNADDCPPAARPGLWPRHLWRRALATCTTCMQASAVSEGAWLREAQCRCTMTTAGSLRMGGIHTRGKLCLSWVSCQAAHLALYVHGGWIGERDCTTLLHSMHPSCSLPSSRACFAALIYLQPPAMCPVPAAC